MEGENETNFKQITKDKTRRTQQDIEDQERKKCHYLQFHPKNIITTICHYILMCNSRNKVMACRIIEFLRY